MILTSFLKPNYFLFVTHPLFQANSYEIDLALGRTFTIGSIHAEMDYLGVVGSYDFHTLSAPPEKTLNYATMVKPYGALMWTLIGISFLVVVLTFILIETVSANMQGFIKIPTRQSLYTIRTNICIKFFLSLSFSNYLINKSPMPYKFHLALLINLYNFTFVEYVITYRHTHMYWSSY